MIVHLTSAASLLADHELLAPPITSLKAFSAVSYTLAKMIAVWANGDVFILFERWLKICPDEHTAISFSRSCFAQAFSTGVWNPHARLLFPPANPDPDCFCRTSIPEPCGMFA